MQLLSNRAEAKAIGVAPSTLARYRRGLSVSKTSRRLIEEHRLKLIRDDVIRCAEETAGVRELIPDKPEVRKSLLDEACDHFPQAETLEAVNEALKTIGADLQSMRCRDKYFSTTAAHRGIMCALYRMVLAKRDALRAASGKGNGDGNK